MHTLILLLIVIILIVMMIIVVVVVVVRTSRPIHQGEAAFEKDQAGEEEGGERG